MLHRHQTNKPIHFHVAISTTTIDKYGEWAMPIYYLPITPLNKFHSLVNLNNYTNANVYEVWNEMDVNIDAQIEYISMYNVHCCVLVMDYGKFTTIPTFYNDTYEYVFPQIAGGYLCSMFNSVDFHIRIHFDLYSKKVFFFFFRQCRITC